MAEIDLIEALNDCIDRLAIGQSIDDCLRAYPDLEPGLRPLLLAGLTTKRAEYPNEEVQAAQARVQLRLESAMAAISRPSSRGWLMTLTALAAAFLLVFAGLAIAAESALPGDTLWQLKRFTENARLALVTDDSLRSLFAQRRINEAQRLLTAGRTAPVTFEGIVQQMSGENWQIAGLAVQVPAAISVGLPIQVGDYVRVSGETTTSGQLIAGQIEQVEPPITVTPEPAAEPTHDYSAQPTPTGDGYNYGNGGYNGQGSGYGSSSWSDSSWVSRKNLAPRVIRPRTAFADRVRTRA